MNDAQIRIHKLTAFLQSVSVLCLLSLRLTSSAADSSDAPRQPFKSIIASGDTIVATLQPEWRRLVKFNQQPPRYSELGESFTFRAGDTLHLTEYHRSYWTYDITPRFSPAPAGLSAKCTYDPAPALGRPTRKGAFKTQTLFMPVTETKSK